MAEAAWSPQPGPQEAAIRASFVSELFYGGAAGGGKSDFLLGDYLTDVGQGGAWQGVLFRKSYPSLDDLKTRSLQIFPYTGGKWMEGAKEWRWKNGACLRFRHFEAIADFTNYIGHQFGWIGWDELGEWADDRCYTRMISRLRGPAERKRIRSTGNPGGVGHQWIQARFKIPNHPTTYLDSEPFQDPKTGMVRLFIPSRVKDNRILLDTDPDYINRLRGVGDEELVKAWLEGDWSALVGAYFAGAWSEVELVESREIPDSWPLFSGLDYGEASPTAWLMGAMDFDKNLWVVNEYYQAERSATEHATEIAEMMEGYPYTSRRPLANLADPSIFTRRRLSARSNIPSEMQVWSAADVFKQAGIYLRPGNNNRVNGWRILKDNMRKGKLKIFKEWCPNLIRTLPALPRDPKNQEDVQTDSEDHAPDALRYMAVHVFGPRAPKEAPANTPASKMIDRILTGPEKESRYG